MYLMKTICGILLLFLPLFLNAQTQQITFDSSGGVTAKFLLPNQKVLITGTIPDNLKTYSSFEAYVLADGQKVSAEVTVNDNQFKILTGPFLPKQLVSVKFEVVRRFNATERTDLIKQIQDGVSKGLKKVDSLILKDNSGIPPGVAHSLMVKKINSELKLSNSLYIKGDGSLKKNLTSFFEEIPADILLELNNHYSAIKENSINDKDSVLKKNSEKQYDDYIEQEFLTPLKKKLEIKDIIDLQLYEVSVMVSEVMHYASIDITPLVSFFKNDFGDSVKRNFGLFFTISPYLFAKIPHDMSMRDYTSLGGTKTKRFWRGVVYVFQPTVGIGFSGNKNFDPKPVFYAGITTRFNKLFKFTTGMVFNTKSTYYSAGLSININYFGEVFRAFQSAQTNVIP